MVVIREIDSGSIIKRIILRHEIEEQSMKSHPELVPRQACLRGRPIASKIGVH